MKHQSTGPRSAEGKAVSSKNALKTGIYAKAETVLPTEKAAHLEALTAEYYQRFHPTTPEQRCLVDALISDEWLLRRFRTIEAELLTREIRKAFVPDEETPLGHAFGRCDRTLERLQRRVNTTRRNYKQTLELLLKLQPEPAPQPVEKQFVPPVPIPGPRPPAPGPALSGVFARNSSS